MKCKKDFSKKRRSKIWTVKWQQTHNHQQLNLKKQKQKQTKQTTRTGTDRRNRDHREGYQWGGVENGGKGTGNKKHKCKVQNRQGEVKNSMGNGEAKVLICMTHGHELRGGMLEEGGVQGEGK